MNDPMAQPPAKRAAAALDALRSELEAAYIAELERWSRVRTASPLRQALYLQRLRSYADACCGKAAG